MNFKISLRLDKSFRLDTAHELGLNVVTLEFDDHHKKRTFGKSHLENFLMKAQSML